MRSVDAEWRDAPPHINASLTSWCGCHGVVATLGAGGFVGACAFFGSTQLPCLPPQALHLTCRPRSRSPLLLYFIAQLLAVSRGTQSFARHISRMRPASPGSREKTNHRRQVNPSNRGHSRQKFHPRRRMTSIILYAVILHGRSIRLLLSPVATSLPPCPAIDYPSLSLMTGNT
ncbi:hypothetical protein B0H12DRAFT_1149933 [Mycena haematopus]|nr:hypothetical protein B0H12DRAFT_1149933 [Mycena haematopus]